MLLGLMTYAELLNHSQDCLRQGQDPVEVLALAVVEYCLSNQIDLSEFNFDNYFLVLEDTS